MDFSDLVSFCRQSPKFYFLDLANFFVKILPLLLSFQEVEPEEVEKIVEVAAVAEGEVTLPPGP